jgi:hypothetical protein
MRWVLRRFIKQTLLGFALVDGANADTNIAVTGIKESDSLLFCLEFATSTNDPTDRTSTTSITSDGNIQCSVATNSDKLLVVWQKRS